MALIAGVVVLIVVVYLLTKVRIEGLSIVWIELTLLLLIICIWHHLVLLLIWIKVIVVHDRRLLSCHFYGLVGQFSLLSSFSEGHLPFELRWWHRRLLLLLWIYHYHLLFVLILLFFKPLSLTFHVSFVEVFFIIWINDISIWLLTAWLLKVLVAGFSLVC